MRRKNVFKAYFCAFHLRMGTLGMLYTKRLLASFATAIFRKICLGPRPPHGQKHKYDKGGPHRPI